MNRGSNYRLVARIAAIVSALCLILVSLPQPSLGGENEWVITDIAGTASVTDAGGAAIAAHPNAPVPTGTRITTDGNGQISLKRGKTQLSVKRKSDIEIGEQTDGGRVTIIQRLGEIFLDVEPRRQQHFQVETPHLTAVVKGTQFTVAVAKSGSTVLVKTGAVEVKSLVTGQSTLVGPSQRARVASDVTGRQWAQSRNEAAGINAGTDTGAGVSTPGGSGARVGRSATSSPWRGSSYDLWDLGEIGLTIAVALAAILGILITVSDAFAARFRRIFGGISRSNRSR